MNIWTQYQGDLWHLKSTDPSGVEHSTETPDQSGFVYGHVTTDPYGTGIGIENNYPAPETAPDPEHPDTCDYDFDGEPDCAYPEGYNDTDSEVANAGSFSQNTCYVDGVEQPNCDQLAHEASIHDDILVTKEDEFPDAAPSDSGPQGVNQNEDSTDDDYQGDAGERDFEQQYTAEGKVSFGSDANVSMDVSGIDADTVVTTLNDLDLQTLTLPNPNPTPTPPKGGKAVEVFLGRDPDPKDANGIECLLRAFLNTIAWAEGSNYRTVVLGTVDSSPNYPKLVGNKNVSIPGPGWPSDHPNIHVGGQYPSNAAGRYQILYKTWKGSPFSGMEFNPDNQDAFGVWQLMQLGVPKQLDAGNLNGAISRSNGTWASLPGSPYGQHPKSMKDFTNKYNSFKKDC